MVFEKNGRKMVITEIVLMKNSFKCSNYVRERERERERERRGQKKCYFRSTLAESFNKFSLLKKPSLTVITKEILFV